MGQLLWSASVVCVIAEVTLGQVTLRLLAPLQPGGSSGVRGISLRGERLGGSTTTSSGDRSVLWRRGTVESLGFPVNANHVNLMGLSSLGDAAAIRVERLRQTPTDLVQIDAYRWTEGGGFQLLSSPEQQVDPFPWSISGDGTVIVGTSRSPTLGTRATRWRLGIPSQDLGGWTPRDVSHNGDVIVGWGWTGTGVRWTDAGGPVLLHPPAGFRSAEAIAVSGDGRTVVGSAERSPGPTFQAVQWLPTAAGYVVAALEMPSSSDFRFSGANDLNFDGSLIVGSTDDIQGNQRAAMWTQDGSLTLLDTLASSFGVAIAGFHLVSATAIAPDGTTIAGTGRFGNVSSAAWVLEGLPCMPCLPRCDSIDFNQNTVFPEDQDVIDFFNVLAGGVCSAGNTCSDIDFNNNTVFPEDADVIDFFTVLAGGECS